MRVYINEDTTPDLAQFLDEHDVESTRTLALHGTTNGELLKLQAGSFDVLMTRDRNLFFQQNLAKHGLGLVVLRCRFNTLEGLRDLVPAISAAITSVKSGEYIEVLDPRG